MKRRKRDALPVNGVLTDEEEIRYLKELAQADAELTEIADRLPLLKATYEMRVKRADILREAIAKLQALEGEYETSGPATASAYDARKQIAKEGDATE